MQRGHPCSKGMPLLVQVAAHEAIAGEHLQLAKEALQQLLDLVAASKETFPPGKEAAVLRNLVKVGRPSPCDSHGEI